MNAAIPAHGGDWTGYLRDYGRMPLDFSANVSPLGTPEGVIRAIRDAADRVHCYPDPLCRDLRAAIAEAEGVPEDWILCGNGAEELIFRLALASARSGKPQSRFDAPHGAGTGPKKAAHGRKTGLVAAPCFSSYEQAMEAAGYRVTRYRLRTLEDGAAKARELRLENTFPGSWESCPDLIMLANPNNPTGLTISPDILISLLGISRLFGVRVALDECFADFTEEAEEITRKEDLVATPGLVILRSFTKLYAMPGVRLGYALCSDADFLEQMRACGPAWSVSALAQAAGIAALRETDYVAEVRALTGKERPRMLRQLRKLGLRVIPGKANFLLFRSPVPLDAPLRQRGILLRECSSFAGLEQGNWYRTAIRTREEDESLLTALAEILPQT